MSYFDGAVAFGWQTCPYCNSLCRHVCPGAWRDTHTQTLMQTRAPIFLHASVSLSHPHSSVSPVSTSSSPHPERSGLITVSDGVYSFPLSHQRHSHQVVCQSGWMSCTCQNHVSRISLPLLLSERVSPAESLSWSVIYACTQANVEFFVVHLPACTSDLLAGEKKKACDEIFLKSGHYLDSENSASRALLLIIWLHTKIPWCCLWKLVRQTPHTHRRNWERERNRWQLTSPLYTDYLKSFHSQHKNTLSFSLSLSSPGPSHSFLYPHQNMSLWITTLH